MKPTLKFLLLAAFISLLFACSESSQIGDDLTGVELKSAAPDCPVFVVYPNGTDDTGPLLQAFTDAKNAGPGSVVQLCEGVYHLGYIEIRDFFGKMQGAGMGRTVIMVMNNLDTQKLWDQHQTGNLIKFVGGDVQLSHFTIQTPPGRLSVTGPPQGHTGSLINFATYNVFHELRNENRSINAVVDHVSFKGQPLAGGPGTTRGYNCAYAIHAGWECWQLTDLPREKVNLTVTNSEFDTFYYGIVAEGLKNCKLTIGLKNQGNVFRNSDAGCGIYQYRDMEILVEGNRFDNLPGVTYGIEINDAYDSYYPFFRAEVATKASTCNVQFNEFNLPRSRYGVYLNNQRRISAGEIPGLYQVRNNQFKMEEGYSRTISNSRTKGMVIRNNNFSGYGEMAILFSTSCEEALVLGNNFSIAELKTAAVYLVATAKNCAVVGGDIGDRVVNMGTNNIITGMNVSDSDTSLGELISDDLPAMNHIMH